ncbi:hypothetical protein HELRODRAFT_189402 [Helobdella robusta]|uniref:Solute carrier organic anion transporter family member n=1 Tax=Helobdella robusta TaxID=6412 RepID=T1FR11_HELRO|nr:hypothetical protein HELRODRAFT_189402 [Helobdella robusta]ESN94472.1 hypothetical protein HELRODRAFT_189402 [Helobdella robusta]
MVSKNNVESASANQNGINSENARNINSQSLEYRCCNTRPAILQCINNIKWVVFFFCLAHCLQNATNGLLGVTISTLQKRFGFSSLECSILASAYEMGQVPAVICIILFGQRLHRPLAIGCGMLLVALGCFLQFLPQFFTTPYLPMQQIESEPHFLSSNLSETGRGGLCSSEEQPSDEDCQRDTNEYKGFLFMFLIGRFLVGVGSTPIVTVGLTYINDCTTKEQFALFSGIFNSMSIVGPAAGVLCASLMLGQFVDFYRVDSDVASLGITSDDARWIGNWWMSYLFLMFFCLFCAIPTLGYANDLPGAQEIRKSRVSEAHTTSKPSKSATDPYSKGKVDEEEKSLRIVLSLLCNPTFLLVCVFNFCDMFFVVGFNAFGPKIFENFFHMQPSFAGLLFGAVLLPSGAIGTILGGFLISHFKMTSRMMIRVQLVLSAVVVVTLPIVLVNCSNISFAGVTRPLMSSDDNIQMTGECNRDCHCEGINFQPVCSQSQVQYFSPCHAGCSSKIHNPETNIYEYHKCACISESVGNYLNTSSSYNLTNKQEGTSDNISALVDIEAFGKSCDLHICSKAFIFMPIFAVTVCIVFICFTMNTAIMFRLVTAMAANAVHNKLIMLLLVNYFTVQFVNLMGKKFANCKEHRR